MRPEILIVIAGTVLTGFVVMFGEANFGVQGTVPEAETASPAVSFTLTSYDASRAADGAFPFTHAVVDALGESLAQPASAWGGILDVQ